MLEVRNLRKSFTNQSKPILILDDLSFELGLNETMSIVGRSGSGKSTLLSIISGLESYDEGSISFEDVVYRKMNEDDFTKLRRYQISTIFQSFHLLSHLNVLENVMLSLEIKGENQIKEKSLEVLDQVGLSHRLSHFPRQLSGGEKQRTAIARSLVASPKLILADEPTGNLDDETASDIFELMMKLVKDKMMSLILVTHDIQLAKQCQHQFFLKEGKLHK